MAATFSTLSSLLVEYRLEHDCAWCTGTLLCVVIDINESVGLKPLIME